jgi:hypothetical protein
MADGEHLKPLILVRTPGSTHDVIADGHHRVLASIDEGQPVWAYVGRVNTADIAWLIGTAGAVMIVAIICATVAYLTAK